MHFVTSCGLLSRIILTTNSFISLYTTNWLVFTHGVPNIYCEVQPDFVYNWGEIPYLRFETSFLTCVGYTWPDGKKVAEE